MRMYQLLEFQNLYSTIKDRKMSLKTAYKLNCIIKKAAEHLAFYDAEFKKIIEEFAKKEEGNYVFTEDGNSIKIQEGKEQECNDRIIELRNLEVEMPAQKIKLEELDNLELTFSEMECLMPFIEE